MKIILTNYWTCIIRDQDKLIVKSITLKLLFFDILNIYVKSIMKANIASLILFFFVDLFVGFSGL